MLGNAINIVIHMLIAVNIRISQSCPLDELSDEKAAYKSGEISDQTGPITLEKIKLKLKGSGIFDWEDTSLSDMEKKEMGKLFDAVEIMVASRNRQPSSVQTLFSSLRLVERVVKKQLKEGQISETLAAKFDWDKLRDIRRVTTQGDTKLQDADSDKNRARRDQPTYYLDKTTNMRLFNIH